MSPALRYIIAILAVLCFVQYIEMARIPRDDEAAQKPTSEFAIGLQNLLNDITEKFKTVVGDDSIKKFFDDFGKALDGTNKDA